MQFTESGVPFVLQVESLEDNIDEIDESLLRNMLMERNLFRLFLCEYR